MEIYESGPKTEIDSNNLAEMSHHFVNYLLEVYTRKYPNVNVHVI